MIMGQRERDVNKKMEMKRRSFHLVFEALPPSLPSPFSLNEKDDVEVSIHSFHM